MRNIGLEGGCQGMGLFIAGLTGNYKKGPRRTNREEEKEKI